MPNYVKSFINMSCSGNCKTDLNEDFHLKYLYINDKYINYYCEECFNSLNITQAVINANINERLVILEQRNK